MVAWGKALAWLAVFGAGLGAVADVLLLYSPRGGYEDPDLAFMANISSERIFWGALLGVLAIPLEAGGLLLLYKRLLKAGYAVARGSVVLGLYMVALGTAVHAAFYGAGMALETGESGRALLSPVAGAFVLGFFTLFGLLIVLIGLGRTGLPRWMAFCTPVSVYLLCLLAYVLAPGLGNWLLPAGFNLGMLVFYALLLWLEGKRPSG